MRARPCLRQVQPLITAGVYGKMELNEESFCRETTRRGKWGTRMNNMKLPVGIESFAEMRQEGFYYIDKTGLIRDLLNNWGKVNLFTRPRRFGKTLNMSMLKSFFEIGADRTLFDGLAISKETALCEEYMGKFPVIFLSLKGVDGLTFEDAYGMLQRIIRAEAFRMEYLTQSNKVSEKELQAFLRLLDEQDTQDDILNSLKTLSALLYRHYGQKTVLLIDEYDVPLDKAFHHGYYREMVALIRGLFGQALKTNEYLQFAVLTGCLRVAKESIFTGLNNFDVNSIVDARYDEHFGFTGKEVMQLLSDYGLEDHAAEMKAWYDGYRFGYADVYCPWDVINHAKKLLADPKARPQAFWINTSGNDLVKDFVDVADATTQDEIERLVAGETIEKKVRLELTYPEIRKNIDNLWSVLFTTGYLTYTGQTEDGSYRLKIPNREVREVFVLQIQEWFRESLEKDGQSTKALCRALLEGDAENAGKELNMIMGGMISVLDAKARDAQKENFYHGLLLGLLRNASDWKIRSNVEAGEGFSDILIEPRRQLDLGIVIEVKYAPTFQGLEQACAKAMEQIKTRRYDERLREDGREDILAYGIAFNRKRCKAVYEKL